MLHLIHLIPLNKLKQLAVNRVCLTILPFNLLGKIHCMLGTQQMMLTIFQTDFIKQSFQKATCVPGFHSPNVSNVDCNTLLTKLQNKLQRFSVRHISRPKIV